MMSQEEYNWEVNLVKDRYDYLDLTFQQAERVNIHEKDKMLYSDKHLFSTWEEWDFDRTVFEKILDSKRFELFLQEQERVKEEHVSWLVQTDNEKLSEISYYNELIRYFTEEFIPYFFKEEIGIRFSGIFSDKSKIDFLKEEYKRYLNDGKKGILVAHFRHNRHFKPNELNLSLLKHKLDYIIPNYDYFKRSMDKPTKAVAAFLEKEFKYIVDDEKEIVDNKFKELEAFSNKLLDKYYKEHSSKGLMYVASKAFPSPEEEWIQKRMSLLLLDEKRYGLKK